ncbi:transcriptional regulator [Collimonas sp. OK412]|jgi:cholera toxin transcriptional activator|uniref:transcriptional regulator n=1 Tax=Collimonas sp. (strain OK412) TaxID=1801619 RepID=UPI0008DECFFB|nr:winged helix-turn-helix domain-containing protein [Collimonas sp. OK412]SFD13484.1 cholera toxin transcriptional activator [Collimonas sp. OK412]
MAKYLICGLAYFDDEYFELTSANEPEHVIQLGAAASRCLLILLEAKGQVVTKKDLLEGGWGQYGNVVSTNNVNQAIAHIRKCFAAFGIKADSVVTIPRIGYKTSDTFFMRGAKDDQPPAPVLPADPTWPVDAPPNEADKFPPSMAPDIAQPAVSRRQAGRTYAALVALAISSTIAAFMFAPDLQRNLFQKAPHASYVPVKTGEKIRHFIEEGFSDRTEFIAQKISMLEKNPPRLLPSKPDWNVYINGAHANNVFSYFLCRNAIENSDADCVSYVIIDEVDI